MSEFFINDNVSEKQKVFLHRILDLGLNFVSGDIRDHKVVKHMDIENLREKYLSGIPSNPSDLEDIFDELFYLSKNSIAQSDHNFLAFPDSAGSLATYAADILSSFLNQNLIAVDRSAPIATFVEAQLISWLRNLIGYSEFSENKAKMLSELGGMWTTGGNMSNHIAILTALIYKFPEVLTSGLLKLKKRPVIILSKGIAHYSFLNAAKVLGLGSKGIIWAETNDDYTTNIDSLLQILNDLPSDVEPFMVVAVAGNCRTSSIDDITNMAHICKRNNIWFHVDACHGGSLLFSKNLVQKLSGIEQADSVTIDPHKSLFVTYSSSYVLFKNPSVMNSFCRYEEQVNDSTIFDLGLITPFYGSRGFDSLKLWLLIKHMGKDKIGEYVEQRNMLYREIVNRLISTNLFVFFNPPEFYRSVFVFFPKIVKEYFDKNDIPNKQAISLIEKYTTTFSEILYRRGNVVLDLFKLNDFGNEIGFGSSITYHVIGMSVGHAEMKSSEIDVIVKEILEVGNETLSLMLKEISYKGIEIKKVNLFAGPASW